MGIVATASVSGNENCNDIGFFKNIIGESFIARALIGLRRGKLNDTTRMQKAEEQRCFKTQRQDIYTRFSVSTSHW